MQLVALYLMKSQYYFILICRLNSSKHCNRVCFSPDKANNLTI